MLSLFLIVLYIFPQTDLIGPFRKFKSTFTKALKDVPPKIARQVLKRISHEDIFEVRKSSRKNSKTVNSSLKGNAKCKAGTKSDDDGYTQRSSVARNQSIADSQRTKMRKRVDSSSGFCASKNLASNICFMQTNTEPAQVSNVIKTRANCESAVDAALYVNNSVDANVNTSVSSNRADDDLNSQVMSISLNGDGNTAEDSKVYFGDESETKKNNINCNSETSRIMKLEIPTLDKTCRRNLNFEPINDSMKAKTFEAADIVVDSDDPYLLCCTTKRSSQILHIRHLKVSIYIFMKPIYNKIITYNI